MSEHLAPGSNNQNLKEIHELGSEIIATQTYGQRTNCDFMSSADIVNMVKQNYKNTHIIHVYTRVL